MQLSYVDESEFPLIPFKLSNETILLFPIVFNATAEIGTCSRLKKYLRKWISLDSATRDKSIQFLKDPKSVSDEDVVDKIPVEVFAVANVLKIIYYHRFQFLVNSGCAKILNCKECTFITKK